MATYSFNVMSQAQASGFLASDNLVIVDGTATAASVLASFSGSDVTITFGSRALTFGAAFTSQVRSLLPSNAQSVIIGTPGDDVITGFSSHSLLLVPGDALFGGPGNDTLDGAGDLDILSGGTGQDLFVFRNGEGGGDHFLGESITDFQRGEHIAFTRGPVLPGQYLEHVGLSESDANGFGVVKIQSGAADVAAVQLGPDVILYVDANDINQVTARITLHGVTLDDVDVSTFVAAPAMQAPPPNVPPAPDAPAPPPPEPPPLPLPPPPPPPVLHDPVALPTLPPEPSAGASPLSGGSGADQIHGSDGNDVIYGLGGADSLYGGTGNDVLFAVAPARVSSAIGTAATYLRGEEGDDYIVGAGGFDDANGNQGDDTVSTGDGNDYAVGGKDNDLLFGDGGDDIVWGNLGNDTCVGGAGDDQVRGGQGDDVVYGGDGADFLSGDRGSDTVSGGAGADIFHTSHDAGVDRVLDFNLGEGDRVQLDPGTFFVVRPSGADTIVDMSNGNQMILVGVPIETLAGDWIFGA